MKKQDEDALKNGAYDMLAVATKMLYEDMVKRFNLPMNFDTLRGCIAQTVMENMGDHDCPNDGDCAKEAYDAIVAKAAKLLDMEAPVTL